MSDHKRAVRLHIEQIADGPGLPLVLSHALGLDHTMWSAVGKALVGTRRVFAYDHRGHGNSPRPNEDWSINNLVDDAAALIESLASAKVVFAGLSMGGMVAQGLLLRHPNLLHGAVLAHTVPDYSAAAREAWRDRIDTVRQQGIGAVVDGVVARYLGAEFRAQQPDATETLRKQLLRMDSAAYARSCAAVAGVDFADQLQQIRLPVAVIAGRHDVGAPLSESERIAAAIPGATLSVMEHSAHLSPLEEPAAFIAVLQRLFSRLES